MFGFLPRSDPGAEAIEALAARLVELAGTSTDSTTVTTGYTYLGQFIDHDITFDPTSKLQRENDPEALVNFRTPRFDLDSLYGSGPADQPFMYDWSPSNHPGVKLLVGGDPHHAKLANVDLPRNQDGRALIGDRRNDENLIISQLHLLFLRFHNKVVDQVHDDHPGLGSTELFEEAQRIVRWHYQWIVMHDFLPTILGDDAPSIERRFSTARDGSSIPVEFSAAAFRFGHSMVREDYMINDGPNVPIFRPASGSGEDLRGFRSLPAALEIRWDHFFRITTTSPQKSKRIDVSLAKALSELPPDAAALARLNLQRGRALGLPAGLDVAQAMGETALSDEQLLGPLGDGIDDRTSKALLRATPLWYYILCEAEVTALGGGGLHLGPVGGRIVAEVLTGLLEADPNSYLSQWPTWKGELGATDDGSFTMADLVRFTLA
jgi:Animal haem peroxidase